MQKPIPLKTSIEVANIKRVGRVVSKILRELIGIAVPGISTLQLSEECELLIAKYNSIAALKGYRGFPAALCTSVNNVIAHGIPSDYVLQEGDLLSMDLTLELKGWYADSAVSCIIGKGNPDKKRLIKAAYNATLAGISAAKAGGRMGDIGEAIDSMAAKYGCKVFENFVGHGIGRDLHEEPMVLHKGKRNTGIPLVPGMVFTIEPILSLGSTKIKTLSDGWSVVTLDNSLTAQFEHTIAIFSSRTDILTN